MVNFRCYHNEKISLPENGTVLISGQSGTGKSTILEAFSYAISGKPNKPYSFGKSTCKVTLYLKNHDMSIVRTSRPNHLLIKYNGEQYEDTGAQGIINAEVCTWEEFEYGCYIKQKSASSLVTMTPMQQLEFVQTIAFDERNIDIKDKVKTLIQQTEKIQSSRQSKLEVLEEEVSNYSSYKELDDPLDGRSLEETRDEKKLNETRSRNLNLDNMRLIKNIENTKHIIELKEKMKNETISLQNITLADSKEKYEIIKCNYHRLNELEKYRESVVKNSELSTQIKLLEEEIDNADTQLIEEVIINITEAKTYIKKHEKYLDLEDEYEEIVVNSVDDPTEKYEELYLEKQEIEILYKQFKKDKQEYENIVSELTDLLNLSENVTPKELNKIISKFIKENSDIFVCPNCDIHIIKTGKTYQITDDPLCENPLDDKIYENLLEYKRRMKTFHTILKSQDPKFDKLATINSDLITLQKEKKKWDACVLQKQKKEEAKIKLEKFTEFSCENKAEEYELLLENKILYDKNVFSNEKIILVNEKKIKTIGTTKNKDF